MHMRKVLRRRPLSTATSPAHVPPLLDAPRSASPHLRSPLASLRACARSPLALAAHLPSPPKLRPWTCGALGRCCVGSSALSGGGAGRSAAVSWDGAVTGAAGGGRGLSVEPMRPQGEGAAVRRTASCRTGTTRESAHLDLQAYPARCSLLNLARPYSPRPPSRPPDQRARRSRCTPRPRPASWKRPARTHQRLERMWTERVEVLGPCSRALEGCRDLRASERGISTRGGEGDEGSGGRTAARWRTRRRGNERVLHHRCGAAAGACRERRGEAEPSGDDDDGDDDASSASCSHGPLAASVAQTLAVRTSA